MSAREQLEIQRLVRAIMARVQALLSQQPQVLYGNVTTTAPLKVNVDGQGTVTVQASLASYSPKTVGDRVLCLYLRGEYVVLGKV